MALLAALLQAKPDTTVPRFHSLTPPQTLADLHRLFPEGRDRSDLLPVPPDEIPEPYRQLLVHTHHMTVTVEGFYGQAVNVKVLDRVRSEMTYGRKILLSLKESGDVVQFGVIEVNLAALSDTVREEIIAEKTPLGRVLIQNNVLRSISPLQFYRVTPWPQLCEWFGLKAPRVTYGRLGIIYAGDHPAIEVLEILAPIG